MKCITACLTALTLSCAHAQLTYQQLDQLWTQPAESAEQMVSAMSIREKIGQVLMLDIRNWGYDSAGQPEHVTVLPAELAQVIHDYRLGSVILFRENLVSTPQSYQLIQDLQQARYALPLLISTDQEGGYVTRLHEGTEMPGNMALAATRDTRLAQRTGEVHGSELRALGISINLAPVVDINTNQNNPVIGVRSFGSNIALVNSMSAAYIAGLHRYSVLATAKHFPGHGNVATDSHIGLPKVTYSESEWRQTDLLPFKHAIAHGVDAIITAHIVMPALDNTQVRSKKDGATIGLPATLSRKIIHDILRNELQFNGLIMTDALDMGAIADNFGQAEAAEQALLAGNDIIVMPVRIWNPQGVAHLEALYRYLEAASKDNPELAARLQQAAIRVVQTKLAHRLTPYSPHSLKFAQAVVASAEHKRVEQQVAEKSVTLIKNERILPYQLQAHNRLLVISDEYARNDIIRRQLQDIDQQLPRQTLDIRTLVCKLDQDNLPSELSASIQDSDLVLLVTYNLRQPHTAAQKIIDLAARLHRPLVVISSRNPYDIAYLERVPANVAIYGITGFDITNYLRNSLEANIRAGLRTLFSTKGEQALLNRPTGQLPVDIRDPQGKIIYPFGTGLHY